MLAFLAERHLATLTTIRADGTPHVVPVGFSYDPGGVVRVITFAGSVKAGTPPVADGQRSVRSTAVVGDTRGCGPAGRRSPSVARRGGVRGRYRQRRRSGSIGWSIEIEVDRVMGTAR